MISNNTSYKVKASKSTRDFDDSDNNYSDENYDNNINDEVNGQIKYNAYSRENNRPKRSARRLPPSEFRPSRINRSKGASGGGRRNDRNGTENVYVLNRKYQENSRLADLGTYHGKFYEPDKKTTSDISTSSNKLSLPEDTRISKLLRRLSTETDQDSSLAISKKLLEVLLLPDNASYVRKAFHILGESMYDILQVSPGAVAKQQAARALGRMGYIMGQENDFERYQSWLFVKIGSADEEIQILLIKSIKETLAFEKTKPVLQDYAEILINNIVGCMEVTDNIEVFKVTLDVLMTTAEIYSNNFYTHFQDTVDILFGWHVDHTQPLTNIEFISKNLQRIGAHFQYNLDFAVSLIENFMEDMNNYADQLHNDSSLEHVTVLILALNTVLRCLGDSFHPKNNKYVTVEFVTNCLTQIIKTATDALDHFVPDNLIIAANESVAMLTAHVDSKTQHLNSLIYGLIDLELSLLSNFTDATVVSVLLLVAKSIKELSANLPFDLIEKLIGPKSELIRLRVSYYQNIQESVSCVYQALLNLKNVSLLQEAYRYVLGDLECLYVQLVPDIQRFIQNNPFADSDVIADLDDDCKEQSVLFLIRCLSQLANASSIIVMWALNPSILELVGVNLEPHHEMLSRNSPAVQYSLLYMLYSHCKCYNNFISSSNLVAKQHDSSVNVMVRFALSEGLSKNDVPNTSPNLGNFEIILEILCKTLSSHTTSEVTLLLLRWLNDILRSSESYLKHLHGNDKFMAITKVLIQCGYQFQSEILLAVCENLNLLLTNKDLTWSDDFLTGVSDLCKLHLNSINVDVRRSYMKLLTTVPWDVTVTEFKSLSAKNNHISNSKMWLAHHLHSAHNCTSTGGISPLQFEMFMNHLLKNEKNPPHWIDDIFYTNWPTDSSYRVTDFHYDMAVNSHAVLFRWLTLECVDFCVNSKLRTPLGKPNETFTKIEAVLNYFGNDLNNRKHKDSVAVAQPVSKGNRVKLLLQFVEHLEKSIYNAAEGCAMAMPPPSKQVRSFFIANSNTCSEWYKRIRMVVIHISLHAGDSCSALRHGQALLDDLYAAGKTEDPEFEKVVMLVCLALLNLGEPEALYGLYSWCKNADRKKFYWLKYAAEQASRRYETALEGYKAILRQLEGSESADPKKKTFVLSDDVQHFIYDQVVICYKKIQNWVDLVDWKNEYSLASSVDNDRKFWFNINDWPCINALFQIEMDIPSFDELSKWEYKSHSQSWSKYENLSNIESNLYRLALNVGANKEEALAQTETNLSEIQQSIRYHIEEVPSYFMEKLLVMQSVACGLKSVLTSSSLNTIMSVSQNFESKLDQIDSSILKNVLWWFEYFATVPGYCTPPFVTDIQLKVIKRARHEKNFKLASVQLKKFLKGDALQIVDNNAAINPLYFLDKVQEVPNWTEDLARAAVEIIKLSYGSDENRQNTFNLCAAASTAISKHADLYGNQELKKISSRILLRLADWLQMNEETCTTELDSQLGKLLSVLPEIAVLERTVSDIIPMNEMAVGKLLQFSINQCASLAKNWNAFGAWCYRWGRKIVDHSSKIRNKFTEEDRMLIKQILPVDAADQDLNEIFTIMSQSCAHNPEEEDIEVNQGCTTETILSQLKCTRILSDVAAEDHLQMLVQIWKNAQQRIYGYYALSAEAYFKYLHLASHSTDNVNATSTQENEVECNVITVTLRLLRLIVKYALELQGVLENGLHNTPTQPWKMVIPQLFSRLNHPESYVRHRVSDLLCRIAEDAPHLITFPAVVGALEGGLKFNFSEISMPKDCLSQDNNACQAEDELNEDEYNYESDDEDMTLDGLQSCFKTMVDTLRKRDFETISQVQSLVRELRRITLLWDELWLGTLTQHQNEISKRQQQLEYEIDRVHQNPNLTGEEKISLIAEKHRIIIKPIVFILEQLHQVTSVEAETPHEKQFQLRYSAAIKEVIRKLKNPECPDKPQESLHPLKHLLKQFQARFSRRVSYSLKMQSISPVLASIRDTLIAMPGLTTSSKTTVLITAVSNVVSILPTKTKPKKLIFYGSDGKEYTYLFKGLEDLHLDERIMQFLSIANTMMATGADLTCPNLYRARHYSVIPLGPRSGLISWVNGTTPLFALYKRWQQRELVKASLKNNTDKMMGASTANNSVPRPSELFYNKLNPLLKEHGQVKNIENRKEWPLSVLKQVLSELMAETPSDLLAKELWCNSTSACSWWKVVKTYSYSVAVMSIIGYIIGLGDRHLDNVLVDLKTGEVVHIDYNVCFEKGRSLRVPEKVPFRLTPNIRRALGVTEVEGIFRVACENVLKTLKKGRETLLTLLEAFVYDPLIDWTSGGEVLAGTTFGGGGGTPSMNSKQNKKNLEREITISMFAVRCTEIGVAWDENKTLILAEIPPLMEKFNRWLTINEKIGQTEDHLHDLHQQMALIKEAEAHGINKHPLYGLPSRYQIHCKSQATLNDARQGLEKIITESQNHMTMYTESLRLLESPQLMQWLQESSKTNGADMNVFDLVKEFLHNAGKDDVITQCEQSENDIEQLFQCQNLSIRRCLQLLQEYNSILMQCPRSYIENHRIYLFLKWAQYMLDTKTVDGVDVIYEKFKAFVDSHSSTPKNMLQFSYCLETLYKETMVQVNKLYEDLTQIRAQDSSEDLETLYANTRMNVSSFLNSEKGATSAYEFVIANELLLLNKNFLTLETAASRSGDLLIKLTSKDGDWFLDDLVLNSTRAVEMINNLPVNENNRDDERFLNLLNGIKIANNVYKGLHELHFNFHTIILPESMRKIQSEELSVIQMIADLNCLVAEVPDMIVQLEKMLPCLYMQMELNPSHEIVLERVQAVRKQFQILVETSSETLTAGKMLLMGFNGLFEKLHQEMDYLVVVLTGIDIPSSWKRLDLVTDSKIIAAHIFDARVHAVLQDVLFLKRLQTMHDFFRLVVEMCQSFSNNEEECVVYTDDQLVKPVRQFIADFISKQLLGITTEAIAYAICFLLQHLKFNVTHEIEQKDIGAETKVPLDELCQKAWNHLVKQGVFTQNVLSQASGFSAGLKRTWEKIQEPKKIELKLTLQQSSALRMQNQLTVYNFMYEETFEQMHAFNTVGGKFVLDLKSEIANLKRLSSKLAETLNRQRGLIESAHQRLNWAKGANPEVGEISQAFDNGVAARDLKLELESSVVKDVLAACNTILLHELLRTHTNESKKYDKLFLNSFEKWRVACQCATSDVEILTPTEENIMRVLKPSQIDSKNPSKWLQHVSETISNLIKTTQANLEGQKTKLFCLFDVLSTSLDKLKDLYDVHCKLMSDVKGLIKSMTKIDEYSAQALQFTEDYKQFTENFALIFSKFKREIDIDDIAAIVGALKYLQDNAETVYEKMLNLEKRETISRPPLTRQDCLFGGDDNDNNCDGMMSVQGSTQLRKQESLNNKGQQRNAYAVSVWRRVKMKLEGRDPDPGRKHTTEEQVDYVIQEATNMDNLALLYEGWTPWV